MLYFHGGHEPALTASAAELYVAIGYSVLAISRPGYGATSVGAMSPANFAVLIDGVRSDFGRDVFLAVVWTSFGGPQAVACASQFPSRVRSLILHSAAPPSPPFADRTMERLIGPLIFHPWSRASHLEVRAPADAEVARTGTANDRSAPVHAPGAILAQGIEPGRTAGDEDVFSAMRSWSGLVIDLSYARPDFSDFRRRTQKRVICPTLVTASRNDNGVAWKHAEDFLATIPNACLIEIPAASDLFWIVATRARLMLTIGEFLAPAPHTA